MGKTLEVRERILRKMRLFVALTLLVTALCVTNEKNIHSGQAPTNCKLVFNSTSLQMDCEREERGWKVEWKEGEC
jgi:hypothetical protein